MSKRQLRRSKRSRRRRKSRVSSFSFKPKTYRKRDNAIVVMLKRLRRQVSSNVIVMLLIGMSLFLMVFVTLVTNSVSKASKETSTKTETTTTISEPDSTEAVTEPEVVKPVEKSPEAKQAQMAADMAVMSNYGLYYDYANLSLIDTVNAFLAEMEIDPSQVAFTYKNMATNEVFAFNDTQPMTAGSTYKLPLNMLVVDAIAEGKVSPTERYDITNTQYENQNEHDAYVHNYDGAMTIADMQYGSIVVSENTPAYALADRIGGIEAAYSQFNRYGESHTAPFPTFQLEGNKTTTSYYIQVLDYLYKHQDKYADLMYFLDEAFPGEWYEQFVHNVPIYQKPGYVREALNVDAIVKEETPYIIALYTAGFGGASAADVTINGYGYNLVTMLCYVINEWHRVNMNPALPVEPAPAEATETPAVEETLQETEAPAAETPVE